MVKPKLLSAVSNASLREQLSALDAYQRFNTEQIDPPNEWVPQLISRVPQLAIIEANDFNHDQLEELISSKTLNKVDVVFISNGEPNSSIDRAMQRGATYHLREPIDFEFLNELLEEIIQEFQQQQASAELAISSQLDQFGLLVGSSPVMRRLYRVIRKAAESEVNMFLVGESGAGKELAAQTIHLVSNRSDKPFIAINCGALSPELIESELFGHLKGAFSGAIRDHSGVFQQAEGGTLFLDEVTEMPLEHQVKLLRVIEAGEYRPVGSEKIYKTNVRMIAATNREPEDAIKSELFREDLYYRLAHFPINVPPLREREEDIVGLAKHFLAYRNNEEGTDKHIAQAALEKIASHTWPGNVRELKHTIERAYILADTTITENDILLDDRETSESAEATLPHGVPLSEVEKGVIMKTLEKNDGNKSEAAKQLGISVKTLYNKLEKYDDNE
ncbi:sigma-54 dependent transcriptional regulator [Aurantivibrio plasticivorans]